MTIFSEDERRFLFNEFTELNQNANQRDLYGSAIVTSVLRKLTGTSVDFTPSESAVIKYYLVYRKEGLARLTDKRLQFILQSQNSQGFGAPGVGGPSKVGGPGGGGSGDKNRFFNSYTQYNFCISIIEKLNE